MIMTETIERPVTRRTGLVSLVRPLALGSMLVALSSAVSAQNTANPQTGNNIVATPGPTQAEFKAQSELIQKLLGRIDQLEKNDAEWAAALAAEATKAQAATDALKKEHEAREQKLQGRIGELEGKVGSIEAG